MPLALPHVADGDIEVFEKSEILLKGIDNFAGDYGD